MKKGKFLVMTSALAVIVLLMLAVPMTALAADNVPYLDASGILQSKDGVTEYNGQTTLSAGWYVVSGTHNITNTITVTGDVHLILADGCDMTVTGINAGIRVTGGNSLTIYSQSLGTGILSATSDAAGNAGIGGNIGTATGGNITINGGMVTATGGADAAGIGGGHSGAGGNITINGGTVITTGSTNAAGIGGGINGAGGTVAINGGNVTATGAGGGAGIGSGNSGTGGSVTIDNSSSKIGVITAIAGNSASARAMNGTVTVTGYFAYWTAAGGAPTTNNFTNDATTFAPGHAHAYLRFLPASMTPVTFTAVQTGGASGTEDSKNIQIIFSPSVTGLTADNITITNGTGAAVKGTLTGSGATYNIALASVTRQGDVTVSVAHFGNFIVTTTPQTVAVHMQPILNLSKTNFHKSNPADVAVTLKSGFTLSRISRNAVDLINGTDYAVGGQTITIKKEYLAALDDRIHDLVFHFNNSTTATLKVTVSASPGSGYIVDGGSMAGGLTWDFYSNGLLIINGTGAMPNWSNFDKPPWDSHRTSINKVIINDGVTTIGDYAFAGMMGNTYNNLTEAVIANSVTTIGQFAFDSGALENVTLPNNLATIGDASFRGTKLTTITIPKSVTTIENRAFLNCSVLSSAIFEGNPTTVTEASNGNRSFPNTNFTIYYYAENATAWTAVISGGFWNGYPIEEYIDPASADNAAITAAKGLVENATYSASQAAVTNIAQAKSAVENIIATLSLDGVNATVIDGAFTAAAAGTHDNLLGTNGSYTFTVNLNRGVGTQQTTKQLTLTITATHATVYNITVNGGAVTSISNSSSTTQAAQGATVTVTANDPLSGQRFKEWTASPSVTFAAASATPTTFTMTGAAVEVTANFVNIYNVTYSGNGHTGGAVPTDANSPYNSGATVTVLGNVGSLVRTNYAFANWNTAANGGGASYAAGETFTISANTTLYAQWTEIPPGAPAAPTSVSATAGDTRATVSFTGSPEATSYTVTAVEDVSKTAVGTSSPITVTGLTNGTSYTFTVTASNSEGSSAPSSPSNAVIPTLESNPPTGLPDMTSAATWMWVFVVMSLGLWGYVGYTYIPRGKR